MKAYGTVAYIVLAIYIRQGTHSSLIMSKLRVAPLKLTLSKLELMAALIGIGKALQVHF